MSGYLTADHHVKKKKCKMGDPSLSDSVLYAEHSELEGSRKKKKNKHRSTDNETLLEDSCLDNLSPSYSSSKFKEQEDNLEQELSNQDYNFNTPKSPKKRKKKKRIEMSVEKALEETGHTGHSSLYDGNSHSSEVAVSEEVLHSEYVRKKKKRHRTPENRNLEEDVLEDVQETSSIVMGNIDVEKSVKKKKKHKSNKFLEEENLSHDFHQSIKTSSQCQVASKKSRHKCNEVSVEEAVEETAHTSLYDGNGHSSEVAVSERVLHSESVRKKKKRHRPPENRSMEEDVLEDVQETFSKVMENVDIDVEHSVRKKKKKHKHKEFLEEENLSHDSQQSVKLSSQCQVASKKSRQKGIDVFVAETSHTGQPSLCDGHDHPDEMTVSEEVLLGESVRKKKKRHGHPESRSLKEDVLEDIKETSPLAIVNEDSNVEKSLRKKKKKHKYEILEKENLSDDIQQAVELSNQYQVASKKSRQKRKSSVEETDHTGQPSLYNGHSDEVAVFGEALPSESVRKKRKRHRSSGAESTFNAEREPKTFGCLSPKDRNVENETVTEDMSFMETTDLESSVRKKKKKHWTKETDSQTESSICKSFKKDTSPKTNSDNDVVAEGSENEQRGENLDPIENITEATNSKTDAKNAGTRAKRKKSVKLEISDENQDQDVPAELEESDKNQVENTLGKEDSVPRKNKVDRCKPAVNELLCAMRERDRVLLEEYFPKIRSMAAKTVRQLIGCELKRIQEAKKKGIRFETGRFDSTEDELIKENVEAFMELLGLESGEMLFHSYRFPDQKSTLEKFKKTYSFRQRIATGVPRSVAEVYNRASKLYDLSGNKGRFTKEDVEKLKKGVAKHGNDWITIGKLIGRNNKYTQLKASQLRHVVTGGKWSNEEVNRLIQAVKIFILSSLKRKDGKDFSKKEPKKIRKEMLFTGIPWRRVEEMVQTRNWTHCKSKWNDVLLVRMNDGIRNCARLCGLQTNIEIIKWLHEVSPGKGQVNWLEMSKAIGNIPPGILQQKVYKLKSRNVPQWQSLNFKEIVDYLCTAVLPKLEVKVNMALNSEDTLDMPEKKKKFLFSDIFKEYDGDGRTFLSKEFCI